MQGLNPVFNDFSSSLNCQYCVCSPCRECNRRQQVIGVLNDLYAAAFLRLSRLWEQQHGTVANAGFFLKGLSSQLLLPLPTAIPI